MFELINQSPKHNQLKRICFKFRRKQERKKRKRKREKTCVFVKTSSRLCSAANACNRVLQNGSLKARPQSSGNVKLVSLECLRFASGTGGGGGLRDDIEDDRPVFPPLDRRFAALGTGGGARRDPDDFIVEGSAAEDDARRGLDSADGTGGAGAGATVFTAAFLTGETGALKAVGVSSTGLVVRDGGGGTASCLGDLVAAFKDATMSATEQSSSSSDGSAEIKGFVTREGTAGTCGAATEGGGGNERVLVGEGGGGGRGSCCSCDRGEPTFLLRGDEGASVNGGPVNDEEEEEDEERAGSTKEGGALTRGWGAKEAPHSTHRCVKWCLTGASQLSQTRWSIHLKTK